MDMKFKYLNYPQIWFWRREGFYVTFLSLAHFVAKTAHVPHLVPGTLAHSYTISPTTRDFSHLPHNATPRKRSCLNSHTTTTEERRSTPITTDHIITSSSEDSKTHIRDKRRPTCFDADTTSVQTVYITLTASLQFQIEALLEHLRLDNECNCGTQQLLLVKHYASA